MTQLQQRSWGRFGTALGALALAVVGIPAFLIVCSRLALNSAHPLPGIGSVAEIRTWISRELSISEMVPIMLRTLIAVGWTLWALLTSSVLSAVVTSRPRFSHWTLPTLSLFDGFAGWVAVGLTTVSSFAPSITAFADGGNSAPILQSTYATFDVDHEQSGDVARSDVVPDGFVQVQTGESIQKVAQRTLGDSGRWEELWELRDAQFDDGSASRWTQPWRLEAGWMLKLPAGSSALPSARTSDAAAATAAAAGIDAPPETPARASMTVGPNGSYWQIATDVAAETDSIYDVAALTRALRAENAPRLGYEDPNLLHPGDVVFTDVGVTDPSDSPAGSVVVVPGGSYWNISVDTLATTTGEIPSVQATHDLTEVLIAHNAPRLGYSDPAMLHPGDVVETLLDRHAPTPSGQTSDPTRAPEVASGPAVASPDTNPTNEAAETTVVEPATTEPTAVEPATVEPDLSLPATVAETPSPIDAPAEPAILDKAVETPSSETSPRPTGPPAWPDDVVDDGTRVANAPDPSTSADTTTSLSTTPTSSSVPAAPGGAESSGRTEETAPSAPAPIRAQHAGLLAAGVLALVGVRRRQRLRSATPRTRVPEPRPGVVATERQLRTIDSGERATRVDVAIRAAAHALVDTDAQVGFALLGLDGDIELRISRPAVLPPPWQSGADDSQTWLLPAATPVELLAEAARRVGTPCVALVQLGVSGHRDVIIDLEACGTLAVDANGALADQIVTAIATSLATSPYAEISHLITVSLSERSVLGHRNAHRAPSATKALQLAASLVGSTRASDRTSFSLRSLRTGGEMWEPAIVLLAAADQLDTQSSVDLPPPGHGVGVVGTVAPGALRAAPARLVGRPDRWELVAFGASIDIEPVGISTDDLDELAELVDDAATPLVASDETILTADDLATSRADSAVGPDSGLDEDDSVTTSNPEHVVVFEPRDHQILVRLMGGVDVMSADGRPGSFERSKTVELIAWLATHRHASTRAAARTALWELDVRDATFANVVSESRRALGRLVTPPGDDEWVGRTLTEQLPLHEGVVTDAELIEERLTAARVQSPDQAIDTLRPAAEMIRDMPFAGTSYLWPDAEGITSNLVLLATSVTTELAGHALSLGDTDTVFWATGQGLKVLSGHEELIGLRMRAHARAGDLAGVRQEWESYERVIVADAWSDGEPAPKLLELRRTLLTSPS